MLEDFGRKKHNYLYFILLGIFVLVVFLIQTSFDFLPKFFGILPTPLLALVVTIGFFNSENVGFTVGLFSGLLMDLISDKMQGFNTILLLLIGLAASLLCEYLINRRMYPCLVVSLILCFLYYAIYWLFFEFNQGIYYLFRVSVLQSIYTWLFIIPFYFIFKTLSKKLIK